MKKIVINRGDEYRAKVELQSTEESVFYDAYIRAKNCVKEIVSETEKYCVELETNGEQDDLYRGYGNNIVAFCGERGAGKTSTMVSVAKQLKEELHYEILQPIDPTMLMSGNSIIMVFLSYLFKEFEEWFEKNNDTREQYIIAQRGEVVQCFEKCYKNLNCVRGKGLEDIEEDDLEKIAQLGDSTELRKNLCNLVELYLKICKGKCSDKEGYLIVQIDDTDLAVTDAFQICEDIRKYLKFPRIIVFMAVNYDTLRSAVYQNYIARYEKSIRNRPMDLSEDLQEATSRYLEKMFPKGHRVDLPQLDWMMQVYHGQIRLEYKVSNQSELDDLFENCQDIQEQLLKFLYIRTGIIFLPKKKQCQNSFLPRTMRELTHFVKMLYDMEDVNVNDIFTRLEDNETLADCEKLRKNLSEVREYFLENWCSNYLSVEHYRLMLKLNKESIKRDFVGVGKTLFKYIFQDSAEKDFEEPVFREKDYQEGETKKKSIKKKDFEKNITYRFIMKKILEENLINDLSLQNAICIYYTIFLNEWFAEATVDHLQYALLMDFLEYPIEIPEHLREKKYRCYQVMYFEVGRKQLSELLTEEMLKEHRNSVWGIECCFRGVGDSGGQRLIEEYRDGKNSEPKLVWNEEVENIQFDILQPMIYAILDDEIRKKLSQEEENDEGERSSVEGEKTELRKSGERITTFLSIKNIVTSYELQNYIARQLEQRYKYFSRRKTEMSWSELIVEFYGNIDAIYQEKMEILGVQSDCKRLGERLREVKLVLNAAFLVNENNDPRYVEEYGKKLVEFIEKVKEKIVQCEKAWKDGKEKKEEIYFNINELINDLNVGVSPKIIDFPVVNEDKRINELGNIEEELKNKLQNLLKELADSNGDIQSVLTAVIPFIDEKKECVGRIIPTGGNK